MAFDNYATVAPAWYAAQLDEALAAAHALGVPPGHVVTASVFTTQTITSVMERIRDDIKAATPAPADFQLGPSGERAVFARADVASITWRQHTSVNPPGFADTPLNLGPLQNIPNTIGMIAFGRFVSPDYTVHPGEYIPAVGTLAGTPPVTAHTLQYFTLYLPSGPKPATGWPVALMGGGATGNQHQTSTLYASKLAQYRHRYDRYQSLRPGLRAIGVPYHQEDRPHLARRFQTPAGASIRTTTTLSGRWRDPTRRRRASGPSRSATHTARR